MITYQDVVNLESEYIQSSLLTHHEFKLLFFHIVGKDFNPVDAERIDDQFVPILISALERRKNGEPIQYVIGSWPFLDLNLFVDNRALIPRPETELLALKAEKLINKIEKPIVCDLCSGNGAIALYLDSKFSSSQIDAIEISAAACDLIQKNKKYLNSKINVINNDVIDYLASLPDNSIDLFVSNPPYVCEADYYSNYSELKYEPSLAFIANENGLFFYYHMTPICYKKQNYDGYLLYEIGEDQGSEVKNILVESGYSYVEILKDYNQLDRYVIGKKI